MKKSILFFGLVAGTLGFVKAQNVNIPDANFKTALLNHIPVIDTNGDDEIQVSEAEAFAGMIDCYNKNIADLTGIEAFVNLTELMCAKNQLTSIDVTKNTALTFLDCSENQLTSLDVNKNTALTTLNCYMNQLTAIDVSKNVALTRLDFIFNQLTNIDVTQNTSLKELWCYDNQLTSLDVSKNTALEFLACFRNQLTSLDLSKNTTLTTLGCSGNQLLTSLNLKNGNNAAITTMAAQNNPNLTCIQVDDAFANHPGWQKDATALYSTNCSGGGTEPIVYIPDVIFKTYLLTRADININGDSEIQVSEAEAFAGEIICNDRNIADLTGIEAFINIITLDCKNNYLTSIDVSKNTFLKTLDCWNNQLTSLDISKNTALEYLDCDENKLTSLDVSKNTALIQLWCISNQLTSLDVSKNIALIRLGGGDNQLTNLDITNNTALTTLYCYSNQLTSLDVTQNTALIYLYCATNQLTSLNLKNGNNALITTMNATNNPNLTCIQVDNVANANSYSGWQKDATAKYNTDCNIVYIPDANFKAYLVGNSSINTNGDSEIQVSEATVFTGQINCFNMNITDLTGIEAFVNLTQLWCDNNQLTSLDVTQNTALQYLYCRTNQLTSLDVTKNTALKDLRCNENQLTTLDITNNTALTYLVVIRNQLSSLDVSKNTALNVLLCYENQLTSLDVSKNTALTGLECRDNPLTSLDVSQNTALWILNCSNNQLTSLDTTKNTALQYLYCYVNQLTSLDVTQNTALTDLWCYQNQLTSLNLKNGNNSAMTLMYAHNNPNLTCIQVDDASASNTYTDWQKDATASYSEDCLLSVADITKKEIAIYPNPVKEILNFSEEVSNVRITDLSGRTVKQISASAKSVNVANLAKGVYIITATAKTGETITKKIIKE